MSDRPMPFDSTPPVTPALALLRAARARIEDPRNWVKHAPAEWEMAAGLHCLVSTLFWRSSSSRTSVQALDALTDALLRPWRQPAQFSDAPETTHADIMMLFDRAERQLMEGGA